MASAARTFQLTHPVAAPSVCPACGKPVKDMRRHGGSALCATEARRSMIERNGLVEVWFREKGLLNAAGVPVMMIRDQRGKRTPLCSKPDRKRWYAAPEFVRVMRTLAEAGVKDARIAQLLRGPKDEIERELAVVALSGAVQRDVRFPW